MIEWLLNEQGRLKASYDVCQNTIINSTFFIMTIETLIAAEGETSIGDEVAETEVTETPAAEETTEMPAEE